MLIAGKAIGRGANQKTEKTNVDRLVTTTAQRGFEVGWSNASD